MQQFIKLDSSNYQNSALWGGGSHTVNVNQSGNDNFVLSFSGYGSSDKVMLDQDGE